MNESPKYKKRLAKEILIFFGSLLSIGLIWLILLSVDWLQTKYYKSEFENLRAEYLKISDDEHLFNMRVIRGEYAKQDSIAHSQEHEQELELMDSAAQLEAKTKFEKEDKLIDECATLYQKIDSSQIEQSLKWASIILFSLAYPIRYILLILIWSFKTIKNGT